MYSVYVINNGINDKQYIGYTKQPLEDRLRQHINQPSDKMLIGRAIKKYGSEHFTISLLEEFECKEDAVEREIQLIADIDPEYNIHPGGTGGPMYGAMNGMYGKQHTDQWKKKRSIQTGGVNNPMHGKNHTEETKTKISVTRKKRIADGSITLHNKGVPMSEEHKQKLRKPKTEEHKQKLRNTYLVVETDGTSHVVDNMQEYCKQNGHSHGPLTSRAKHGKLYKGMKIERLR